MGASSADVRGPALGARAPSEEGLSPRKEFLTGAIGVLAQMTGHIHSAAGRAGLGGRGWGAGGGTGAQLAQVELEMPARGTQERPGDRVWAQE